MSCHKNRYNNSSMTHNDVSDRHCKQLFSVSHVPDGLANKF